LIVVNHDEVDMPIAVTIVDRRTRIYISRCDGVDVSRRNQEIVKKYDKGSSVWVLATE